MTHLLALSLHVVICAGIYQIGWVPASQVLGVHYFGYMLNLAVVISVQKRLTRNAERGTRER